MFVLEHFYQLNPSKHQQIIKNRLKKLSPMNHGSIHRSPHSRLLSLIWMSAIL
ncbi:hypothetical Protein YC6258_00829 [Gynuella sunshinyii YC6258]|uniref:Uncharacterized protein n=1 Tax=Gynuella sunshinyii YC6258 TaxID=1445510 RepID=A0A0C5VRJ0_9GAMM|nr:hypothetical Protein YC6258_00829 [Gynuella sunshinyii YC6258]